MITPKTLSCATNSHSLRLILVLIYASVNGRYISIEQIAKPGLGIEMQVHKQSAVARDLGFIFTDCLCCCVILGSSSQIACVFSDEVALEALLFDGFEPREAGKGPPRELMYPMEDGSAAEW